MPKVTFDGPTRLIAVNSGITSISVEADLYSDWKEWVLTSDSNGPPAFRTTGGDPLPGGLELGAYFFLQNQDGWRIRPQEADHELLVTGNIYPEDGDFPMFVPTLGDFTCIVSIERSGLTQVVLTGSGVTEQDKVDIADRVWDELAVGHIGGLKDIKDKTDTLPDGVKKNTALANFMFVMIDSADHVTPKTGLTITAQRSIDGAGFGACANSPAEVANGVYKIDLAAGDLNGDVITLRFTASGADPRLITILTQV